MEFIFLSSKGLIADVCPMALRAERLEAAVFCVDPGNAVVDTNSCPAPQHSIVWCRDTDPISEAPGISPGHLQEMHSQEEGACLHPVRDLLCQHVSGRGFSASSLQDRSKALQILSCCSSTSASAWLLKAGEHATVRGEDAFWGLRRHSVQVKCRV